MEKEKFNCPSDCSVCAFSSQTNLNKSGSTTYTDYACVFDGQTKCVMISDLQRDKNVPKWCPLSRNKTKEKIKYSEMTWGEKLRAWESLPPITPWEEIKPNTVYHIPPYHNEKREDVLVTQITANSITYKRLNDDSSRVLYTLYPTSMKWKFFSEHKIKEVKLVSKN